MDGQNQAQSTTLKTAISEEALRSSYISIAIDLLDDAEAKSAAGEEPDLGEKIALHLSNDRIQVTIASALHSIAADLHKIAMRPMGARS